MVPDYVGLYHEIAVSEPRSQGVHQRSKVGEVPFRSCIPPHFTWTVILLIENASDLHLHPQLFVVRWRD
jgi:hypothetical protein